MGALKLSAAEMEELSVCWNDAFRKVYGFNRWESVSFVPVQLFTSSLPFNLMYDYYRWNFYEAVHWADKNVPRPVSVLVDVIKYDVRVYNNYRAIFNCISRSKSGRRRAIVNHFSAQCAVDL